MHLPDRRNPTDPTRQVDGAPGRPIGLPPGLAGCVQAGAEKASAATTATPVRRCFMGVGPPLQPRALSGPRPGSRLGWDVISSPLAHTIRVRASIPLAVHRPAHLKVSGPLLRSPKF